MIRNATTKDLEAMIPLAEEAYKGTVYEKLPKDLLHTRRMLVVAAAMENIFCKVVEDNGKLEGVIAGAIEQNIWGTRIAQIVVLYAKQDTQILVRSFLKWAKRHKVVMISIVSVPGNIRYDKLITRLGFESAGAQYIKRV